MRRILFTGSRHMRFDDREIIESAIREYLAARGDEAAGWLDSTFVHGAADGADAIVADLCRGFVHGPKNEPWPAKDFGPWPQCGPIRNSHMVKLGAEVCLAFPAIDRRSDGTEDCMKKAIRAGIPTRVYPVRVIGARS